MLLVDVPRQIADREIKLNTSRKAELKKEFDKPNNTTFLILIQSIFRGMAFRKKLSNNVQLKLIHNGSAISPKFKYIPDLNIECTFYRYYSLSITNIFMQRFHSLMLIFIY